MPHAIAPIPCKPCMLNGLSERLVVSHYGNNYGAAVRSLNAIRNELQTLDFAATPNHRLRASKHEERAAMGSMYLHELYFATLGGDGATLFTGSGRVQGRQRPWRRHSSGDSAVCRRGGGSSWRLLPRFAFAAEESHELLHVVEAADHAVEGHNIGRSHAMGLVDEVAVQKLHLAGVTTSFGFLACDCTAFRFHHTVRTTSFWSPSVSHTTKATWRCSTAGLRRSCEDIGTPRNRSRRNHLESRADSLEPRVGV